MLMSHPFSSRTFQHPFRSFLIRQRRQHSTDLDSWHATQVFETPSPAHPTSEIDSSHIDATPTSVELPQKRASRSPPSNVAPNKKQSIADKMQETQHAAGDDSVEIVEMDGDYIYLCFVPYFISFLIPLNIEYKGIRAMKNNKQLIYA